MAWKLTDPLASMAKAPKMRSLEGSLTTQKKELSMRSTDKCTKPTYKRLRTIGDLLEETLQSESGCAEWQMATRKLGYGQRSFQGKTWQTHRLAWVLANGPIPKGMQVLHRCDNPPCINPEHLFLGTHADNMADKVAKGRHSRGQGHGMAKLTRVQAWEVYQRCAITGEPLKVVALDFGITVSNVSMIKRKHTWKHMHIAEAV